MSAAIDDVADVPFLRDRNKKCLIDGQWIDAASGKRFDTLNPSNGKVLASIADGDAQDIDRAVRAARRALDGPWKKFTPAQRERVLLRFADLVDAHYQELLQIDSHDMGSPIGLKRPGTGPGEAARYYAGWATKIRGETLSNSISDSLFAYTVKDPIGVVGSIIPWNNPTSATVWKIAPVLASGCTMVLKPSEVACLAPLRIGELVEQLDLPPGVINIVTGGGAAGAALSEHADVDKIAFTGSGATGQAIMRAAAGNMKRLTLEMGGKSPQIIFADANLDEVAPIVAMSVFGNAGQMCVGGTRIFVEQPIYEELLQRMAAVAAALKVGSGQDPSTQIGPIVSQRQLERVMGYIDGRESSVRTVAGGRRLTEGALADGYFVQPTIFADVRDDMQLVREEIFGPVAAVMPFTDVDDVIRRANATPFGLGGGVWTRDIGRAHRVARSVKAGTVWVNTYLKLDPNVPYGGLKTSGYGTELGYEGLAHYLSNRAIWINQA